MKEKVDSIVQKIKEVGDVDFLNRVDSKKYSFSLMDLTFIPVGMFFYYIKQFFALATIVAAMMTILALGLKSGVMCGFETYRENAILGCANSDANYALFFVVRLFFVAMFINAWYKLLVVGDKADVRIIFTQPIKMLKTFLHLLLAIFIVLLPLFSFLVLFNRVPNSNPIIEILFFAVFSSGFWLPIIASRFLSVPAFAVSGYKMPKLSTILYRTKGNSLKIILALAVLLFIFSFLFISYSAIANSMIKYNMISMSIIFDYICNLLYLFLFMLFFNHCLIQQGLLFGAEILDNEIEEV